MVNKHRLRSSLLLLLLLPLIVACGGSATTPATQGSTAAGTTGEASTAAGTTGQASAAAGTTDQASTAASSAASAAASTAGQTQPAQPVADVEVVLPYLAQGITSFDPAYWTSQLLVSQGTIFEGLYGYDPQLNVVPKVAQSATANEDNTVWTIKLRQDKKWSNGDPVTANDFYAAWMRAIGPELKDAPMWVGMAGMIKNSYAYKAGAVEAEEVGIKVLDDYTIQVTLTRPNAAFVNLLPVTNAMPIHAATLQAHPTDWWDPKNAVYNGPYIVQSWTSGADTVLTRNPNYVGEGIGNVGTVILRPYEDPNSLLQAFENGELHFTFLEDPSQLAYAQNIPEMQANMKEELQNLVWQGIQYNRAIDPGPLGDDRVRQAFAMAIDKQAITDQVLKGLAVPTTAFSGDPQVTEQVKPLPFDPAKAKQLLADAGFPNGQGLPQLTFYAPPANDPRMPMIEAVVKMWQDNLGANVVIQNNEGPVYSKLQWSNFNKDIQPGFSTLGGPMNWFQPLDLLLNSGHIFWFMDYKPGGVARTVEISDELAKVADMTTIGDWAELEQRANTAWTQRQEIIAQEQNEWGQMMQQSPTFREQFDAIAKRFNEAADDEAKLSAYKDALRLLLAQERELQQYNDMTDRNKQAQRLMAKLQFSTMEEALPTVVEAQQLAVDSAWMVPIYNNKLFYTTAPQLSNVVLNQLSWGHIFQYQYLQWNE